MATCKDCLHVDVCCSYLSTAYNKCKLATPDFKLLKNIECDECQHFKDRSRFVELPCKVGDVFYVIEPRIRGRQKYYVVKEVSVFSIHISKLDNKMKFDLEFPSIKTGSYFRTFTHNDFGKTVFLTLEEAEQALKERDGSAE
jgi:hypothetical protein